MKYQLPPIRRAQIQNSEDVEQRESHSLQVGMKNGTTALEEFFTKLSILLPYDPAVVLCGIHRKDLKTYVNTKTCTWMFIHHRQNLEATKVSCSRWMNKYIQAKEVL